MSADVYPTDPKPSPTVVLTEESEPVAQPGPNSMGFIIALAVLLFWAFNYLDRHGGGFNARVYEPFGSLREVPPDGTGAELGKMVFEKNCAVCHLPSGLGQPGLFPPLAGSDWVTNQGPNRVIRIVLNGLQGPIKVKNVDFNNNMFPFEDLLKDDEVAAVITYIRQSWGNDASPVTVEQVKAIRDEVKGHAQWTAEQLLAIPEGGAAP